MTATSLRRRLRDRPHRRRGVLSRRGVRQDLPRSAGPGRRSSASSTRVTATRAAIDLFARRVWHFIDVRASASFVGTARRWTSPDAARSISRCRPARGRRTSSFRTRGRSSSTHRCRRRSGSARRGARRRAGRSRRLSDAIATPDGYEPIWGPINSERLPRYERLDLSVSTSRTFGARTSGVFFASVDNATDRNNFFEYAYSADYSTRHPVARRDRRAVSTSAVRSLDDQEGPHHVTTSSTSLAGLRAGGRAGRSRLRPGPRPTISRPSSPDARDRRAGRPTRPTFMRRAARVPAAARRLARPRSRAAHSLHGRVRRLAPRVFAGGQRQGAGRRCSTTPPTQLEAAIKADGRFAEAMGLLGAVVRREDRAHAGSRHDARPGNPGRDARAARSGSSRTTRACSSSAARRSSTRRRSLAAASRTRRRRCGARCSSSSRSRRRSRGRTGADSTRTPGSGQALAARRDNAGARAEYEKALAIAPNSAWVKYSLLPQVKGPEW